MLNSEKDFWNTIGHPVVKGSIESYLNASNFHHAQVFLGPKGVGKNTLALEIITKLLGQNPQTHPDFLHYDGESSEGVYGIRKFLTRTTYSPVASNYNLAVIDNTDELSVEELNVLLKTLEEPHASSIFFLICHSRKIPSTVFSRCVIHNFQRLDKVSLKKLCERFEIEAGDLEISSCGGSFGQLLASIHDNKYKSEILGFASKLISSEKESLSSRLVLIGEAAELETDDLKKIILASIFMIKNNLSTVPDLYRLLNRLLESLNRLNSNINKKLILQGILIP